MNIRTLSRIGPAILALAGRLVAADPALEILPLPPLRIDGVPARLHTQGLEVVGGQYYVTGRREDVRPQRALLLRTVPGSAGWDSWDITPLDEAGKPTLLNHPGGLQSDGKRLWIPLAESRAHGRSRIGIYPLEEIVPGKPLRPEKVIPVDDHIGAIAVSMHLGRVLGANWDSESVHVWDLEGRLLRTLSGRELGLRDIGATKGDGARAGLAVQDWKFAGETLLASGLYKHTKGVQPIPQSRLMRFERFLESDYSKAALTLPVQGGSIEPCHEAMAIDGASVLFLPEDLGATNRLFRLPLSAVTGR